MDVPPGWQVTRQFEGSLQMADGTAADDTANRAGTATAVFDLYLDTPHTVATYRDYLRGRVSRLKQTQIEVDGADVIFFDYIGDDFAGTRSAALVPKYKLLFEYRAAFAHDSEAFNKGLPAFKAAVRSMRFSR